MTRQTRKAYLPIILVFTFFNCFILVFKGLLERNGFDQQFLIMANLILFVMTAGAMAIQLKGLRSPNPQAFVRGVYGSLIIKMFVTMVAIFLYAFLNQDNLNKPGIFTSMGMYIVYTVVEVISLMKAAKNNAR